MRLEGLAVDRVHRLQKEARDILFHAHVVEDGHMGVGVKLDQDVYVAIRAVVAASLRAE
jgi:ribosomal protein S5